MVKRLTSCIGIFLSAGLVLSGLSMSVGVGEQVLPVEAATTMGQLASGMAPGTWAKLETNGLDELLDAPGSYTVRSLLEYADGGAWDAVGEQFFFIGGGHDAIKRFIVYSAQTNTWTELPQPDWIPGHTMRGYDQTAINIESRELFHLPFGDSTTRYIYKYDLVQGVWRALESSPYSLDGYVACCVGLEYFPELGGLILADGSGGEIAFYDSTSGEWTGLARGLAMGEYHNFAEYNPIHGVMLAGGGNGSPDIYRVDPDGSVTTLRNAPVDLLVSDTVTTTDPVSGDYLILAPGLTLYAYDVMADQWRVADANPPLRPVYEGSAFGIIASPVPNYGVTMFVIQADWYDGEVWLYKHAASDPPIEPSPTEPPPEPTPTLPPPTEPPPDNVIRVGPNRQYTKPSQAAAVAQDGDVIEIDAGEYRGDVAIWYADNLTIRGVGGMAHLIADGKSAEGKAIWVIKGSHTTVEYIEFSGATVPDQNGAGIRQEGQGLTVRYCYFHDNENGILGGGGSESDVLIEYSEFARNGYGDGYSHNMYISNIRSFTLRYSYSHRARVGHNVKTRARENYILYNRLMDEADGNSSYVVDIPDGGTSYLIGNLIQQGPITDNSTIVSYGAESLRNGNSDLYVINNTIVNDRGSGTFIRVPSGATPAVLTNNIFMGSGKVLSGPGNLTTNLISSSPGLVDASNYDYRLIEGSAGIDAGSDPGSSNGFNLLPINQYVHKANTEVRPVSGTIDVGAYEFGDTTSTFVDVPPEHWAHDYIEVLYQEGYVAGCSVDPLMFCPDQIMTRAESAVFVERGVHGADHMPVQPTEQIFADVPLHEWFAKWATALWKDGYTEGCGTDPLMYCPLQGHTRTEGCVFFLRMMHGADYVPPDPEGIFADVPLDGWGAKWVEAAYNAGLIPACETEPELKFCPDDPLDRAMGAYMMVQAKGLEIP